MGKDVRGMKAILDPLSLGSDQMAASAEDVARGYQTVPDTDIVHESPRYEWDSGFLGRSNGFER